MSQSQRDSHERNFVISTACSGNLPLGGMMTDDDNMWMMVGDDCAHRHNKHADVSHVNSLNQSDKYIYRIITHEFCFL